MPQFNIVAQFTAFKGAEHGHALILRESTSVQVTLYLHFVKDGETLIEDNVKANSVIVTVPAVFAVFPNTSSLKAVSTVDEEKYSVIRVCCIDLPAKLSASTPTMGRAFTQALLYHAESLNEFSLLNGGHHDNVCHLEGVRIMRVAIGSFVNGLVVRHHIKTLDTVTPEEKSQYTRDMDRVLGSIRSGLDALHRVDMAINYLTPGSVAVNGNNTLFLLGPFTKFGVDLTSINKPSTWRESWGNPKKSEKQNDEEAFKRMQEWLDGQFSYQRSAYKTTSLR